MFCYVKRCFIIFFMIVGFAFLTPVTLSAHSENHILSAQQEKKSEEEPEEDKNPWQKKVNAYINVSQYSYSNWSKGGENALAWSTRLETDVAYRGKLWGWECTSLIEFGQVKLGNQKTRNSKDMINADAALLFNTHSRITYYLGASVLTQFTKGFNYEQSPPEAQSDFWDPAYLTQSLGMEFKVGDVLNSKVGAGFKQTFTKTFTRYVDNPKTSKIETYKFESGIESKTKFDMQVLKNLHIRSLLGLFSSYEHPQEVDINWDSLFISKIGSFFTFSFNVQLLYDKNVTDKVQLKEELGVGVMLNIL